MHSSCSSEYAQRRPQSPSARALSPQRVRSLVVALRRIQVARSDGTLRQAPMDRLLRFEAFEPFLAQEGLAGEPLPKQRVDFPCALVGVERMRILATCFQQCCMTSPSIGELTLPVGVRRIALHKLLAD